DVETASDWEATLPEPTGDWALDVVAIAESQLGYTESTKNFTLADDGITRQGYTRYGAWYGNEYGDWDAMFASFCLYYAGVEEDAFPQASGAYAWMVSLKEMDLYVSAEEDTPLPGDLIFFDTDEDEKADRVGIVTEVNEENGTLTVIEGDYSENEDDADAVCETEYAADSSTIVGYGFLPSSDTGAVVSEDGEEETLTAATSSARTLLTAAGTGTELNSSYYDVSVKDVEYADGTVKASLYLDLIEMVTTYRNTAFEDGYVFIYYLDVFEGVDLTTSQTAVYAEDGVTVAYWYEIKYDNAGGKYYVEFTFNEDFINSGNTIDQLYFYLAGTVNENYWEKEDDGSITIQVGTESLHISYDEIKFTDDSETTLSDINVEKSGTYDAGSNTISYEIIVSSVNGTGKAVTLADILTFSGSIVAEDYTVTATVTLYDGNGTDDTSDDTQVSTETKTLSLSNSTLELDALDAGQYYMITYDVVVDTGSDLNVNASATNKISVSTEDSEGTPLNDDDTDITYIIESLVSKSGTYDSKNGTITWTITVNASGVNIAGYVLTDIMLADATITVDPDVGYTSDGDTITFNAVKDTDGDGDADSNTDTYTIKYTTPSDQTLGDKNVTNTAGLSGDGKSGEATVTVTADGGSLTKANTNDSSTTVNSDGTITLAWTSSLTVPTGGSADGTVIWDYLGGQWSYGGGVSSTHQWYTYDQITTLFQNYFAGGIQFTDGTTTYPVSATDFTMEAYYFSNKTDTLGEWVDYQTLVNSSTYEDGYFTAWRITFNSDISFSGNVVKLTLVYETTADTADVDGVKKTSESYFNYMEVGDLSVNDAYTYKDYAKVVKTDGNNKSDDSSHIITGESDDTLTWIVKVYIAEGSDYEFVTVTDTL
ncbi:MAG: CHAP domain-containing protein, partial [Clostridiales bacterium]|nr:CHAP domain-containing protein [Clostridiales bacterium]